MKKNMEAIGLKISSPRQAMEIIHGLLEVIRVSSAVFKGIAMLIEDGDTEKALEILKQGSDAVLHRTADVLEEHVERLTDEELNRVIKEHGTGEPTMTANTKCAGNA